MHWEGGIIKMYYFQCFPSLVLDRVWEYSSHSENWLPQKTSKEGRDCKQLYLRFLRDGKQTQNWQPSFHFIYFSETKHFVAFSSQTPRTCGIADSSFLLDQSQKMSPLYIGQSFTCLDCWQQCHFIFSPCCCFSLKWVISLVLCQCCPLLETPTVIEQNCFKTQSIKFLSLQGTIFDDEPHCQKLPDFLLI